MSRRQVLPEVLPLIGMARALMILTRFQNRQVPRRRDRSDQVAGPAR